MSEKRKPIKSELPGGPNSIDCIGPEGENLARYETVISEDRAASSGVAGAMMKSRDLLAVALAGRGKMPAAPKHGFWAALREANGVLCDHPTIAAINPNGAIGDLATNDTRKLAENELAFYLLGKGIGSPGSMRGAELPRPYPCDRSSFISCGRRVGGPTEHA